MAEEAVQDAFTLAVARWPSTGLPPSPAGWIITAARNRVIDRLRREASREDRHAHTALLHASNELHSYQPYGKQGLLFADIDLKAATGLIAARCKSAD